MNDKLKDLMYGEDYEIIDIIEENEKITIELESNKKDGACCPNCGRKSRKISGTYDRLIQDIPIRNQETWVKVKVRQYYCCNQMCRTKVFSEEVPFARTNQVKTDSLIQMILAISLYLSNSSCSLILSFMGIKVSADTIQNIYNGVELEDDPDIDAIGIDDVATRKGRKYATAIYNLNNHKLIALLDGRDSKVVKEWLKNHKKIKIVARDRASAYASAVNKILPNCIQVADRFHLFENLIKKLQEVFSGEVPKKIYIKDGKVINNDKYYKEMALKETKDIDVSKFNYDNSEPVDENGQIISFDNKKRDLRSKEYEKLQANRKIKYDKVKAIQKKYPKGQKHDYKQIAQEFGISIPTARTYVKMDKEKVEQILKLNNYKKRKTVLDDYLNIIFKMLKDGLTHDEIFAYIISKGYDGDYRGLSNYIYYIAKNNFPKLKIQRKLYFNPANKKGVTVITQAEILRYIFTINEKHKNKNISENIGELKKEFPIIKEIEKYYNDFHDVIMGEDESKLDKFIKQNKESHISSFVKNLKKDLKAIKNAISQPISSGFVEGNNNKFKLIKRIVYGKSCLVNLFKKCFLLFWCTKSDFNIKSINIAKYLN